MTTFLTTTFSPTMLKPRHEAEVIELWLEDALDILTTHPFVSAVGHEITAQILSALCGFPVAFNRANLSLGDGDVVIAIIPNFRANEAREFTKEEVLAAGLRCFGITVKK